MRLLKRCYRGQTASMWAYLILLSALAPSFWQNSCQGPSSLQIPSDSTDFRSEITAWCSRSCFKLTSFLTIFRFLRAKMAVENDSRRPWRSCIIQVQHSFKVQALNGCLITSFWEYRFAKREWNFLSYGLSLTGETGWGNNLITVGGYAVETTTAHQYQQPWTCRPTLCSAATSIKIFDCSLLSFIAV